MRFYLLLLPVFLLFNSCKSQQKKAIDFHPIVLKAKETSLYTDRVDWNQINNEFINLVKDNESDSEMKPALQYLINSIGDKHGTFRSAKDYSVIVGYTGPRERDDRVDSEFYNTVIIDPAATFTYKLLDHDIGYLKVVGIGPGNIQDQADQIRNGLIELKAKGVNRWIVDLRYNGGGNMNPMMAGLAPLIGEGFVGGSVDQNEKLFREYMIKEGQFYDTNNKVGEMSNQPKINVNEKIAILLSQYTISSGELVAIAFKGRDNVKFIGEHSGGLTTGNGFDQVTDDLVMVISQSIMSDRNHKIYDTNVPVDEYIKFEHTEIIDQDKQIAAAISWLRL